MGATSYGGPLQRKDNCYSETVTTRTTGSRKRVLSEILGGLPHYSKNEQQELRENSPSA
ncbi:hypothetical protein HAX54_026049, partial [Datura stramonium]|nr:hypothetical protein [Datura stramonium]